MCAKKRSERPLKCTENAFATDHRMRAALIKLRSEFRTLTETYISESEQQKEQGHPIVANLLHHMGERLSSSSSLEQFAAALDEIAELTKWIPEQPRSHVERK